MRCIGLEDRLFADLSEHVRLLGHHLWLTEHLRWALERATVVRLVGRGRSDLDLEVSTHAVIRRSSQSCLLEPSHRLECFVIITEASMVQGWEGHGRSESRSRHISVLQTNRWLLLGLIEGNRVASCGRLGWSDSPRRLICSLLPV